MDLPHFVIPAKAGIQRLWRHQSMEDAILREKRLKKWYRAWKLELVEKANPYWRDLYPEIVG